MSAIGCVPLSPDDVLRTMRGVFTDIMSTMCAAGILVSSNLLGCFFHSYCLLSNVAITLNITLYVVEAEVHRYHVGHPTRYRVGINT